MDIEKRFDSPIIVIGFRGHPINRFCYDVIYKGKIKSALNASQFDDIHKCYSFAFEDLKKEFDIDGQLYRIEKYSGTIEDFITKKYFKSPMKRVLYSFYLLVGRCFKSK